MSDPRATGVVHPQRRRLIEGAAGTLVLSLAPWQIARGAALLGVRVWPAPAYTRVTLEHDAPLTFTQFMVRDTPPLRLVVEIDGIDLTPRLTELIGKIEPDDPYIARVRLGQNRPRVVRLVVELKTDVAPEVFALPRPAPTGTGWCSTCTRARRSIRWPSCCAPPSRPAAPRRKTAPHWNARSPAR
ncbi:MAG: AMIN domain-containing protein [Betaproteobacteria bacterium]